MQHQQIESLIQAQDHKTLVPLHQSEARPAEVFEVFMRCVTWTKDSNGLFDYESKNIAKKNIKTQTGGKIVRIGDEIQLVSKNFTLDPQLRQ